MGPMVWVEECVREVARGGSARAARYEGKTAEFRARLNGRWRLLG